MICVEAKTRGTFVLGVGGFALGGGWSWKTNQYGLTIDTIVAFDVVTPTGKILHATETSEPDLFFGLKVCYLSCGCFRSDSQMVL